VDNCYGHVKREKKVFYYEEHWCLHKVKMKINKSKGIITIPFIFFHKSVGMNISKRLFYVALMIIFKKSLVKI